MARWTGRSRWAAVVVAACTTISVLSSAPSSAAAQQDDDGGWMPFYESGPFSGAGWASCPAPITVSLSYTVPRLPKRVVDKWVKAGIRTLLVWMRETGLVFDDGGVVPVTYDPQTGVLSPTDGVEHQRHIYLSIVPKAATAALTDRVVGLGAPTEFDVANREITQAQVTFELEYVRRASVGELTALLTHEFGHALGLGHSTAKVDVMYPIVTSARDLGPGDVAGIRTITRPCASGPEPSRDYPLPDQTSGTS